MVIFLSAGAVLFGETGIQGTRVTLNDGVIDLRTVNRLPKKVENAPRGYHTPEDLRIGSVFIDANNEARKVVDIYEENGRTVIETIQPEIEEAIHSFTIPDQEIPFTRDNIDPASIHEGVTVLGTQDADASAASRAIIGQNAKWLETDPEWMGEDVISVSVDIPILGGSVEREGGPLSVEASGEVRLKGIVRIAEPTLTTGAKMPKMNFKWVHVWGPVYRPDISFEDGYLKAEFSAAQQMDCVLSGSVSLSAALKIPLYALIASDEKGNSFTIGIYLKVTVDGEVTIAFEISEYTNISIWGNVDIFFPFIPYDVRMGSSSYANFALRPTISAEIEKRIGIYLGLEGSVLGFGIFGAEAGGGLYANASGYMEAKGIIGYNTDYGAYGGFDDGWNYDITLELGGYVEANMSILLWDFDLYEEKWPFLTGTYSGEL
jgi:hypothetical protein